MKTIILNGEARQIDGAATVAALLETLGHSGKRLAVERNGEIVPKSQHAATPLDDQDHIEIVIAVGGG